MIQFYNWPDWADLNKDDISNWLKTCVSSYDYIIRELSYTFMDNQGIQKLNEEHLKHSYPTDIISFDYSAAMVISGEIYIGSEVVRENAVEFGVSSGDELCRVMIHGVLHLIGFDDQDETQRSLMRQTEDKCLLLRPKNLINK